MPARHASGPPALGHRLGRPPQGPQRGPGASQAGPTGRQRGRRLQPRSRAPHLRVWWSGGPAARRGGAEGRVAEVCTSASAEALGGWDGRAPGRGETYRKQGEKREKQTGRRGRRVAHPLLLVCTLGCARGWPGSTCISPVALERCTYLSCRARARGCTCATWSRGHTGDIKV